MKKQPIQSQVLTQREKSNISGNDQANTFESFMPNLKKMLNSDSSAAAGPQNSNQNLLSSSGKKKHTLSIFNSQSISSPQKEIRDQPYRISSSNLQIPFQEKIRRAKVNFLPEEQPADNRYFSPNERFAQSLMLNQGPVAPITVPPSMPPKNQNFYSQTQIQGRGSLPNYQSNYTQNSNQQQPNMNMNYYHPMSNTTSAFFNNPTVNNSINRSNNSFNNYQNNNNNNLNNFNSSSINNNVNMINSHRNNNNYRVPSVEPVGQQNPNLNEHSAYRYPQPAPSVVFLGDKNNNNMIESYYNNNTQEAENPLVNYFEQQMNEQNIHIITLQKKIDLLISQNIEFKKEVDSANSQIKKYKEMEEEFSKLKAKDQSLNSPQQTQEIERLSQLNKSDKIELFSPEKSRYSVGAQIEESQSLIKDKQHEIQELQNKIASNAGGEDNSVLQNKVEQLGQQVEDINNKMIKIEQINQYLDQDNQRLQQMVNDLTKRNQPNYNC